MSNYLPHYTKRLQIRRKKEEGLRRLICQGGDKKKLLKAAEEVRLARIRALNARKATIPPSSDYDARVTYWDNKILALQKTTAEAILVEFGQSETHHP